jgi:hypothetical protein
VAFQVVSDASITGDGWYVDDVVVANVAVQPFNKISPSDGATGQPASLTLHWEASSGATGYDYCYDTLNNNGCDTAWLSAGASTSAAVSGLASGATYFWQVRARRGLATTEANAGTWWTVATQNDVTPPTVTSATPASGATGISVATAVTATFSEPINAATLTAGTFVLRNAANAVVTATVTYNAGTRVGTLTPSSPLAASTTYTATISGGAAGVKDLAGNALASSFVRSFTTAAITLGSTAIGSLLDSGDSNALNGSKVRTSAAGHIASMSAYVGNVDTLLAKRLYQVAIYTDNAGRPGTLVAVSSTGTLVANAWNTVVISASLLPSTTYWLMFNTNGRTSSVNNMRCGSGSAGQGAYSTATVPFGTWPATFTATVDSLLFSLFATFGQ